MICYRNPTIFYTNFVSGSRAPVRYSTSRHWPKAYLCTSLVLTNCRLSVQVSTLFRKERDTTSSILDFENAKERDSVGVRPDDVAVQNSRLLVDHVRSRRDVRLRRLDGGRSVRRLPGQRHPGKFRRRSTGVRHARHFAVRFALLAVRPVARSANRKTRATGVHREIGQVSVRVLYYTL